MKDVYAWIPWFEELCGKIVKGGESELARRASEVQWKADGNDSLLLRHGDDNIDPFSFLYTLATGCKPAGARRRLCDSVGRVFELATEVPVEVEEAFIFPMGVPMNALFPDQGRSDPALLWRLFCSAADVYQLYAYAKRNRCRTVALIYPRNESFRLSLSTAVSNRVEHWYVVPKPFPCSITH